MRFYLAFIFFLLTIANPLNAAEFNIKLRKTDISELKQQLMPGFEQNIDYLKELLACLENGKAIDVCLNEYSLSIEENESISSKNNMERKKEIKESIENKISEKNIQSDQIIAELKKLLSEAESIKDCLNKGQTANDLKDCITKH